MQGKNTSLINPDLDERLPDYVRAELAGNNVAAEFPDMYEYVTHSEHARQLHDFLMETEKLAMMGLLPKLKRQIPPDLTFLGQ